MVQVRLEGVPSAAVEHIKEHGIPRNCERLGCITRKFKYCKSPMKPFDWLGVCPPCFWARGMWDDLNKSGESKAHQILRESS